MLIHQNERIFEFRSFRKRFVRYISNIRFSPNVLDCENCVVHVC